MGPLVSSTMANKERPYSVAEMQEKSAIIADGEITRIIQIESEQTPHPDGKPIISTKYKATFNLRKSVKGVVLRDERRLDHITLVYWQVLDARFKGDVIPELKIGDKFRLYADSVIQDESGDLTVATFTANSIRPEAFGLEVRQNDASSEQAVQAEFPKVKGGRIIEAELGSGASSPTSKAPNVKPLPNSQEQPASKPSFVWFIMIVAVIGLLWLVIKSKRHP